MDTGIAKRIPGLILIGALLSMLPISIIGAFGDTAQPSGTSPIQLGITLDKAVIAPGGPLNVTVVLRNTTKHDCWIPESSLEQDYHVMLRDATGKEAPLTIRGATVWDNSFYVHRTSKLLKPGEQESVSFDLADKYDLSDIGSYTLTVSHGGVTMGVDGLTAAIATSGPIRVTVDGTASHGRGGAERPAGNGRSTVAASSVPMLAVRTSFENHGFKVKWDDKKCQAVVERGGKRVVISAGRDIAFVDGRRVRFRTVAELRGCCLYAPEDLLSLCATALLAPTKEQKEYPFPSGE